MGEIDGNPARLWNRGVVRVFEGQQKRIMLAAAGKQGKMNSDLREMIRCAKKRPFSVDNVDLAENLFCGSLSQLNTISSAESSTVYLLPDASANARVV